MYFLQVTLCWMGLVMYNTMCPFPSAHMSRFVDASVHWHIVIVIVIIIIWSICCVSFPIAHRIVLIAYENTICFHSGCPSSADDNANVSPSPHQSPRSKFRICCLFFFSRTIVNINTADGCCRCSIGSHYWLSYSIGKILIKIGPPAEQ